MGHEPHTERAVRIEPAAHRHRLLVDGDGAMLRWADGTLAAGAVADDGAVWDAAPDGFRHVVDGYFVKAHPNGTVAAAGSVFEAVHGPEVLPSASLAVLREQGWVCLTEILAPSLVDELQRLAGTDGHPPSTPDRATPRGARGAGPSQEGAFSGGARGAGPSQERAFSGGARGAGPSQERAFSRSPALARAAAEPVSLWIVREYLQTQDIRFSHTPALIVLTPDDGKRNVQGWHSDYPYHWGIRVAGQVPEGAGGTPLGLQRNVCVSQFSKARGATAFKLGSHAHGHGPPEAWGTAAAYAKPGYRAAHGLPYSGPEADVIEAPAGSIILYDARTWHRAGVNRTAEPRAAILQAMTPMFVLPKNDTSGAYRHFLQSEAHTALTSRERRELRQLMVHRFLGPAGRDVFAGDKALSELFASE